MTEKIKVGDKLYVRDRNRNKTGFYETEVVKVGRKWLECKDHYSYDMTYFSRKGDGGEFAWATPSLPEANQKIWYENERHKIVEGVQRLRGPIGIAKLKKIEDILNDRQDAVEFFVNGFAKGDE